VRAASTYKGLAELPVGIPREGIPGFHRPLDADATNDADATKDADATNGAATNGAATDGAATDGGATEIAGDVVHVVTAAIDASMPIGL
jgi:hypothetical protein